MLSPETLRTVVLTTVLPLATLAAVLGSVAVVGRLYGSDGRWGDVVRSRLVMGVPWGSLIVLVLVYCVYLFVQDGITAFDDPVTIPYRAYSYFYPLGMVTAAFSHASSSHLIGNLSGALVAAPIAEYAWGHYPSGRGEESFSSWRTNPWLRALVIFPLVVVGVTLLTSLFALGPVIGFSGVVFAFAAFALVHYPIATIVGVLGVQGTVLTLYRALQLPIGVYVARPSAPSAPSWAGIAIQGHALGFFIGLALGIAVLRRRDRRPDPLRIWLSILVFGFAQGLWQIYWFGGQNTYILFQGPGVFVVTVLALVVTVAIAGSDSPFVPRWLDRRLERLVGTDSGESDDRALGRSLELARNAHGRAQSTAAARLERIGDIAASPWTRESTRLSTVGQRQTAYVIVLAVFAALAGVAIPSNLFVLGDATVSSEGAVEIEDYTVQYAEGVEDERVSPVQVGPLADAISLESSGVIVTSEQRQLWSEVVPARQLEFSGRESVSVGGPGWRETVHVERRGWVPVGNDSVYQVEIWADGEERRLAHESNESRAAVKIDGRYVTVASEDGEFRLEVESNGTGTIGSTTIPEPLESTTVGGVTFERQGSIVYAVTDGTRVAVARQERYGSVTG